MTSKYHNFIWSSDISMETTFIFLFLLFTTLLALASNQWKQHHRIKKNLPPGKMSLPWIGETMAFYKAQRDNRLFEDFIQPRVSKYGKIFKTRVMGSPTVIITEPEANRFFLSNEFKLVISSWPCSSVQLMGRESIMEKQGSEHRFLRGLIGTTLGHNGLDFLVPQICELVQAHLHTKWKDPAQISLYYFTKNLTFTIVFECLLGIKVELGIIEMFERVLEGVFAPAIKIPGCKFSRAMKARKEIEIILKEIVRKKRVELEENFMNGEREEVDDKNCMLMIKLVLAMIRGEISEKQLIDNVVLLVFAAHDTTSFAIAMTFKMLAHHPNSYELLLKEHMDIMIQKGSSYSLTLEDTKKMKYTWQVARESMRLFPPIFGSFRKAIVDIEYEGFMIPRGWKVLWTTYSTHYDPNYFPDPTRFDPSRFESSIPPYIYLPFGGGPRVCAGYQLAKLNILVLVHYVVTRYDWSLVHLDEPIAMNPLPFPSLGMPIKVSPKSM